MVVPALVVLVGVALLVGRWAWRAMKRSDDPAAQKAVTDFEAAIGELREAPRDMVRRVREK